MKKAKAIASLLVGVFAFIAQMHATPQQRDQEIKENVSKKAKNMAAQTKVYYVGSPHFVPIEGTSISYATNTHQEVMNVGDKFYLDTQEVWLVAPNPEGPWAPARGLPEGVSAIVCAQLHPNPSEPYMLCALPW
jgi:hypothetical protein